MGNQGVGGWEGFWGEVALGDERPTLSLMTTHSALGPDPWALVFPSRYDRLWERLLAW